MDKMIQIRNVPEELHGRLKARAALAGMSLSEFLLDILQRAGEQATPEEMKAILSRREPVEVDVDAAEIIREMRGPLTLP